MTASELIVPVEVRALVVNDAVRTLPFSLVKPNFLYMLGKNPDDTPSGERGPAEPEPFNGENQTVNDPQAGASYNGVHVQWELPEALTGGFIDPVTKETRFPLVPNRWLVVRYATVGGKAIAPRGWVVHSDWLYREDPLLWDGDSNFTEFLNPFGGEPVYDIIGRLWDLAEGPWSEPERRELFLTAIGAGLPLFAVYEPYHAKVFSIHDVLADLQDPDATLSYLVMGWYSDPGKDILRTAADIPGLLPPGSDKSVAGIITALGWAAPSPVEGIERTVYSGTALGVTWERNGTAPDDWLQDAGAATFGVGLSTGEAAAEMVAHQLRNRGDGQLFSALYHGTLDTFDGPDGEHDLADTLHRSFFIGSDGGSAWQIRPRPGIGEDPLPGPGDLTPPWLAQLNADQASYDAARADLAGLQWRLWSLHWLRNLPAGSRPADLPGTFDQQCDAKIDAATRSIDSQVGLLNSFAAKIPDIPPDAADPQAIIDAFAASHGLSGNLQLRQGPAESFYTPNDPVLLIEGSAGGAPPAARDPGNPLPCRTGDTLVSSVSIGGNWVDAPASPPDPGTTGLPGPVTALIAELALLDQAARADALDDITADPAGNARGTLAEYTATWGQPWVPMILQWDITWFPTPYSTGGKYNWTFKVTAGQARDDWRYEWDGTGAPPADTQVSEGNLLNRLFRSRAYLAPTAVSVARAQLARYLATYTATPARTRDGLAALDGQLGSLDLLSQAIEGFNDWLLQLDGGAQVPAEPGVQARTGPQSYVPDGAGADHARRFDPVRAGEFFFSRLRIVDRFGRVFDIITDGTGGNFHDQYPVRTRSVTPNRPLYTSPTLENPGRLIQLTPRLLQDTRLTQHAVPAAPAVGSTSPIVGWLLVNYLDRALDVYGPGGQGLGELRVIRTGAGGQALAYTALPHSPYADENDQQFAAGHPHLAGFLLGLLNAPDPPSAYAALIDTIDQAVGRTVDPAPEDDQLPARLIGRPVALIRTDLALELQGLPLEDPSWATIVQPPEPGYPGYTWNIRLGDSTDLHDGLIGYYGSDPDQGGTSSPGQGIDYSRLRTVAPANVGNSYTPPVTNGEDLSLPARTPAERVTRHLTLLTIPHLPVHATTDILPVQVFNLDAGLFSQALAAIQASFRLNPLLATTRNTRSATCTIPGNGNNSPPYSGPVERILDGNPYTWFQTGAPPAGSDYITIDLGGAQQVTEIIATFGELPGGDRTAPGKKLLASADGGSWTELGTASATDPQLSWRPPQPLTTRYLRLQWTGTSQWTTVVRNVAITCDPDDNAIVIPPLSARYGTWTWAEPVPSADPAVPGWDELQLIPADHLTHPDDPNPAARAGYLQLSPPPSEPSPPTNRNGHQ